MTRGFGAVTAIVYRDTLGDLALGLLGSCFTALLSSTALWARSAE